MTHYDAPAIPRFEFTKNTLVEKIGSKNWLEKLVRKNKDILVKSGQKFHPPLRLAGFRELINGAR